MTWEHEGGNIDNSFTYEGGGWEVLKQKDTSISVLFFQTVNYYVAFRKIK